jgi:hypothetical protein
LFLIIILFIFGLCCFFFFVIVVLCVFSSSFSFSFKPTDAIDVWNTTLLMLTCTANGTLLKADKPATSIDATFSLVNQPPGLIYNTYSNHSGKKKFKTFFFFLLLLFSLLV